jgi:hypothetical protein
VLCVIRFEMTKGSHKTVSRSNGPFWSLGEILVYEESRRNYCCVVVVVVVILKDQISFFFTC